MAARIKLCTSDVQPHWLTVSQLPFALMPRGRALHVKKYVFESLSQVDSIDRGSRAGSLLKKLVDEDSVWEIFIAHRLVAVQITPAKEGEPIVDALSQRLVEDICATLQKVAKDFGLKPIRFADTELLFFLEGMPVPLPELDAD